MTYRIDFDALTIIGIDKYGEEHDLNAQGEPCLCWTDLREFIIELSEQGALDAAVRDELLLNLDNRHNPAP